MQDAQPTTILGAILECVNGPEANTKGAEKGVSARRSAGVHKERGMCGEKH